MQLEDFFEFEICETKFGPVERVRIKGHRISIEHVIECFRNGVSPEMIAHEVYPTLDLKTIYATITYYLFHQEAIDDYIRRSEEFDEKFYQDYLQQPESDVVKRLKALKAARAQSAGKTRLPNPLAPLPTETAPS